MGGGKGRATGLFMRLDAHAAGIFCEVNFGADSEQRALHALTCFSPRRRGAATASFVAKAPRDELNTINSPGCEPDGSSLLARTDLSRKPHLPMFFA